MIDIKNQFNKVAERIRQAEATCHRHGKVTLLAVSKTKPIEMINAMAELGQQRFGENYVQESVQKIAQRPDLEWHFIGPIQSNKTRPIAENFNWVHSVDRLKIAQRLNDQRPNTLEKLNVLIEVNISGETSKAGFEADTVLEAAKQIADMPNLRLRGLMCIPLATQDKTLQRQPFIAMQALFQQLQNSMPTAQIDTLSMGMSGDLEAAIECGSTLVRIGTDLFGART